MEREIEPSKKRRERNDRRASSFSRVNIYDFPPEEFRSRRFPRYENEKVLSENIIYEPPENILQKDIRRYDSNVKLPLNTPIILPLLENTIREYKEMEDETLLLGKDKLNTTRGDSDSLPYVPVIGDISNLLNFEPNNLKPDVELPILSGIDLFSAFNSNISNASVPGRIAVDEARVVVAVNSGIADMAVLRAGALERVAEVTDLTPGKLVTRNRFKQLSSPDLAAFFPTALDESEGVRSIVLNAGRFGMDAVGVGADDGIDTEFNNPHDITPQIFAEVFKDEALLAKWMQAVDQHVRHSSADNVAEIDKAAETGEVVKKDFVLVGGGPLTALAASILGPYYNVTVITDQNTVGKPWRNRPIYINSSTEVEDRNGARLPLLTGTTTPMSVFGQLNNLDTDILQNGDTYDVLCDDSTTRKYVSGMLLGDLTATEIVQHADDYIVNQTIDFAGTTLNADGTKRLKMVDSQGIVRYVDASHVAVLSGPGEEKPRFADKSSQKVAEKTMLDLDASLREQRAHMAEYKKKIASLEAKLARKPSNAQAQEELDTYKGLLKEVRVDLPRFMTLTTIEKLMEFWREDLDADPESYPFAPLFEKGVTVFNAGGKDTTRTIEEFLGRRGPDRAYPEGFDRNGTTPQSTLYNVSETSAAEYRKTNRRRYGKVLRLDTITDARKVATINTVENINTNEITGVTAAADTGSVIRLVKRYDYGFLGTGYTRIPIESQLPFPVDKIRDADGYVVGLGNDEHGISIYGSAAGLKLPDVALPLQNIAEILNVPENSISLWLNGLNEERGLWTYIASHGVNAQKLASLAA